MRNKKYLAYINLYLVVNKGSNYIKHIYIGSRRIAYAGSDDDYVNGQGFRCDDATGLRAGNYNPELFQYYYHSDHLGSTSLITNIEERNNKWNTPYLFNAKELDDETGLYYYGARYYDPRVSLWLSTDPLQEKYPNVSTYAYCVQNPVKFVDPDGKSIDVTEHEEGLYRVNNYIKDNDNGVYLINSDGKRGDKIAYTLTPESFYNSDEGWEINMKGAIIDPNDKSGKDFLNNFIEKNPNLISYMLNAGNGDKYDFKSTNGTDQQIYSQPVDYYRGMPVLGEIDGLPIWASARDIGNIAAGFVAARKGLIWNLARFGFDTYQSYKSKKFTSESSGTKFAQKIGHKIGSDYNYNENLNLRKKARLQGEGHLQSIDPIEIFNGIITRTGYQK